MTVRTSRAITVVPGTRPVRMILPLASVVCSPFAEPMGLPAPSVIRKVTPESGSLVSSAYFSITTFWSGVLVNVMVCVSPAFTFTVCFSPSRT